MKKLIYLLLILLSFGSLHSQNITDPPKLATNFNDTTVFDRIWGNSHFIKAWNWGGPGRWLDEALSINYYHTGFGNTNFGDTWNDNQFTMTDSSLHIRNHRQLMQLPGLVGGYGSTRIFNSQAIQFSPLLNVDSTNSFKPRAYDSSGSVFGFYFRRKVRILDTSLHSNPNYHFALLDKDSIILSPDTVLKNSWNSNYIHFLNYRDNNNNITTDSTFNGTSLYLTINLKSRDTIANSLLTDTILKIRLPYIMNDNSTGFIKFDSLASSSVDSIANVDTLFNQDRGRYKKLYKTDSTNKPTEFAITGEMLKFSNSNPADSSLTLSAYFVCDGYRILTHKYNPFLNTEGDTVAYFIKNLDVEVIYCGKIDLGLRYIKIETPRGQAIFRGFYDNLVRVEMDTLINIIRGNNNGVRIHRIYGNDEVFPRCWGAMRYFNMLLDTLVAQEPFPSGK